MRLRSILALPAVLLVSQPISARPAEEGAVETVKAFLACIEKGDMAGASKLISGRVVDSSARLPIAPDTKYRVKSTRVYGNEEETVVVADIEASMGGQTQTLTDTFRLRKEALGWRLVVSPMSRTIPPPSLLAMFFAEASPSAEVRQATTKTSCLTNIKQLAMSMTLYTQDHDDTFPDASRWRAAIMPYATNALFRCPDDKSGAATSYRMNPLLSRRSQATIEDGASTVLLFEGDSSGFVARHHGLGAVAFVDTHAKTMSATSYARLRKKP